MSLRGQLPYELRDNTSWSNMMYGGSRAVLYIDGAPVDTVDLLRGVQIVPGGIIYQPVGDQGLRNVECGAHGVCVDLKPWVLRAGSGVVPLAGAVPELDSILSSPLVLDGDLYYLTFEHTDSTYGVFARWFDSENRATRAVHIAEESLEKDTPGGLLTPVREEQCILFRVHEDRFVFGPGLEACVRGREPPNGA